MAWSTAALTLMLTGLLLAEGISCLRRTGDNNSYLRRFGLLSILLSGLSFILGILLVSGTWVPSSEFGIIMVQGLWSGIGMTLVLVGSGIVAGMALHVCRLQAGRHQGLEWLLSGGLCVGGLVVLGLQILNPEDTWSLHIYTYECWWPPLLIWLSLCLLDTALTAVRVTHLPSRLWLAIAIVTSLALLALSQSLLITRWSKVLWISGLTILMPIGMSVVTWLYFRDMFPTLSHRRRCLSRGLTWLPASSAVLAGLLIILGWNENVSDIVAAPQWYFDPEWYWQKFSLTTSWFGLLWLCWPGVLGSVQWTRVASVFCPLKPNLNALPSPTGQQIGFLITSILLSLGLAALPWLVRIDRIYLLDGYIVAWLLLAEAVAGGPLIDYVERLLDQQQRSAMRAYWSQAWQSIRSGFTSLLSPPSMPPFLAKALVALIVLLFLNELPNAGKTLIHPFKTLSFPGNTETGKDHPARDEIGPAISERVVNTLGLMQQELRQEVILALQPDGQAEDGPKKFELMSVSNGADTSAALANGTEVDISGVKVPLGVLFAPMQGPLRRWLGVRTINGSVLLDHHGYSLLASSDAGETWKISVGVDAPTASPGQLSHKVAAELAAEFAFHIIRTDETLAPALTKSWPAFEPFKKGLKDWKQFETKQDYGALSAAIGHFRQATQLDPGFAFAHYRLGLALQKDGQPSAAVEALRESLRIDANLVPAYIALASTLYDFERGSYLREIGSPLNLLRALRTEQARIQEARDLWLQVVSLPIRSVTAPNLGSAYYGLCRQAYRQGRRQSDGNSPASQSTRNVDAAADVVPLQLTSDVRLNGSQADNSATAQSWFYMAFYYCTRAETLYANLSSMRSVSLEVRKAQAYTLYTLGNILMKFPAPKGPQDRHRRGNFPLQASAVPNTAADQPLNVGEPRVWNCWIASFQQDSSANAEKRDSHGSTKGAIEPWNHRYLRKSLGYFNRALDLLPEDHRIRCSAARTEAKLHNPKPMERLKLDPVVHLNLANGYRRSGRICRSMARLTPLEEQQLEESSYWTLVKQCKPDPSSSAAQYFQSALDEYDEVIRRQPTNVEALMGYTDTLWEQLTYGGVSRKNSGWFALYTVRAVDHTRRVVALSEDRQDSDLRALAQASLGKTFLMQGSGKWAYETMEEVIKLIPNHPAYHDIHWALAQAYLCEASIKKRAGFGESITRPLQRRAVQLKGDLRRQEGMREFQFYGNRPDLPDSTQGSLICDPDLNIESIPDLPIASRPAQIQQRTPAASAALDRLRQ